MKVDRAPAFEGMPIGANGPVFGAPWQAQTFAMTLALHERGLFTWSEWTMTLAEAIRAAQAAGDADLGDTYYRHWLDALEALLLRKGLADSAQLHALEHAWADAAGRTPHGLPIELKAEDLALACSRTATDPPT